MCVWVNYLCWWRWRRWVVVRVANTVGRDKESSFFFLFLLIVLYVLPYESIRIDRLSLARLHWILFYTMSSRDSTTETVRIKWAPCFHISTAAVVAVAVQSCGIENIVRCQASLGRCPAAFAADSALFWAILLLISEEWSSPTEA